MRFIVSEEIRCEIFIVNVRNFARTHKHFFFFFPLKAPVRAHPRLPNSGLETRTPGNGVGGADPTKLLYIDSREKIEKKKKFFPPEVNLIYAQ